MSIEVLSVLQSVCMDLYKVFTECYYFLIELCVLLSLSFSLSLSPVYYVHLSFPLNLHFLCSVPYRLRTVFLHCITTNFA